MSDAFVQIWALMGLILFIIGIGVVKARKAWPFLAYVLALAVYILATVSVVTGGAE